MVNLTNRVYTHDAAETLEYRGKVFCLLCLWRYGVSVNPDTLWHDRVYHEVIPAAVERNVEAKVGADPTLPSANAVFGILKDDE